MVVVEKVGKQPVSVKEGSTIRDMVERCKLDPESIRRYADTYKQNGNGVVKERAEVDWMKAYLSGRITVEGRTRDGATVSVTMEMGKDGEHRVVGKQNGEPVHYVRDNIGGKEVYRPAGAGDWELRYGVQETGNNAVMVSIPHEQARAAYEQKYGQEMPSSDVFI